MSLEGTIFSVKANEIVPDAFLEKVLDQNSSFGGFATAIQQDGSPMIVTILQNGPSELQDIKQVLEEYKDSTCLWHFGNVEGTFDEDDIQPFTVIEEADGVADVVMFMEGNFQDKGGAYEVATKLIIPFMKKIWKGCADVAEFMEELATDDTNAEQMKLYFQGRATITILGSNGMQVSFGTNALLTEYDWGWTSNPCGYTVEKAADPVIKDKPVPRRFGSGRVVQPSVQSSTGKTVAVETKASVPAVGKSKQPELWGPGADCVTKNQIKEWYQKNNNGIVPPGYKDKPLVEKIAPKGFDALAQRPIASVTPIKQGEIKKNETVVASQEVSGEILPVAPPKQKEWLKNSFMKRGSVQRTISDGKPIIDPKRMQATEEKFTTFVEMAGLDNLQQTYHYTPEDWLILIKEAPETAMILMMNLTYELFSRWPLEEAKVDAPKTEAEAPVRRFGGGRKVS